MEGDPLLVVTLTSDFGDGSPYVAALKAAVLGECPAATLVDVSHSLEPFAIDPASFVLWAGTRHFEAGSVHLAVVDPGVGTARRAIGLRASDRFYVGPDNGLFNVVLEEAGGPVSAVELARPAGAAPTFEGRDVFAPAAGRLAAGAPLEAVGRAIRVSSLAPAPAVHPRVVWVDRFGNLVLSLRPPARPVRVAGADVRVLARTFGAAAAGVPFCYEGSMGRLEIGVREGRADLLLGAAAGSAVEELEAP